MSKFHLLEWIAWRLFLTKMTLARILTFKSQAKTEFQSLGQNSLKKGDQTEYEETIIRSFGEFSKNVDPVAFSRLDFYFVLMIIGIILLIAVLKLPFGLLMSRLLCFGGAFAIFMSLFGFIYDMLNKPANLIVKEDEYKKCKRLLEFVGESARKPLSVGMILLILLMVFIDAAMISIVAMDYVADLPRKYVLWGGIGIGLIVAIMLYFFTHEAGKALYRDTKRKELQDERYQDKDRFNKILDELGYRPSLVPHFFLHPKRYLWMCVTLIMIAGLAYAAYGARYNTQMDMILSQTEITQQTLGIETDNSTLPPVVTQAQKEAGNEIVNEHQELAKRATQFALIILTLVFIGIQTIGIIMGYNHAFFDDETEEASKKVRAHERQEGSFEQSMETVAKRAATFLSYYNSALQWAANEYGSKEIEDALRSRKSLGVKDIIGIFKGQQKDGQDSHDLGQDDGDISRCASGIQSDQQGQPLSRSTHNPVALAPSEGASPLSGTDQVGIIASNSDAHSITHDAGAREVLEKPPMPDEKGEDSSITNRRPLKKKKRELEKRKNELEEKLDELEESNADPQEIEWTKREIKGLKRAIRTIEDQLEE